MDDVLAQWNVSFEVGDNGSHFRLLPDWHLHMHRSFCDHNLTYIKNGVQALTQSKRYDSTDMIWREGYYGGEDAKDIMSIRQIGCMAFPLVSYATERSLVYQWLVGITGGPTRGLHPDFLPSLEDGINKEECQREVNIRTLQKIVAFGQCDIFPCVLALAVWQRYLYDRCTREGFKQESQWLKKEILKLESQWPTFKHIFGDGRATGDLPAPLPSIGKVTPIDRRVEVILSIRAVVPSIDKTYKNQVWEECQRQNSDLFSVKGHESFCKAWIVANGICKKCLKGDQPYLCGYDCIQRQ